MDLLCTENINEVGGDHFNNGKDNLIAQQAPMEVRLNTAVKDLTFLEDRCLQNLLKCEARHEKKNLCYFNTIQYEISPDMRKVVVEWIIDLCEEQNCQEEVSLLCIDYMDRYLNLVPIRKTHLQILAAACLLLASKLREPNYKALPVELLVFYTDHSITKNDLIRWELMVLRWLEWDVSTVTPLDFVELLLCRLPIENRKCHDLSIEKVRKHAQAFISLAAREHYFFSYSASTVAASSIAASLSGLKWDLRSGKSIKYLVDRLTDLTGNEQELILECMNKMEALFQEQRDRLPAFILSNSSTVAPVPSQHLQQSCVNLKSSSTTPTDVLDVDFKP